ncbi:hypothetical protein Ddc_16239 [Ditylenchus destructor]|nr:hypothetical protein Ddc_16239 [Ditylenchus destructor]
MASKPHSSTFRGQLGIAFVPILVTYALFLVLTALAITVDLKQDKKQPNNGQDQYFEDLFHIAAFPVKFNRPSRVVPLILLSGISTILVVIYVIYALIVYSWRKR